MEVNTLAIERILNDKEGHTGYYLGEFYREEQVVVVLFSLPEKLQMIAREYNSDNIPLSELYKLVRTQFDTNICLTGQFTPFQQYYISIEKFNYVEPLTKFENDTLKVLLNHDFGHASAIRYAHFINNELYGNEQQ